MGVRQTRVEANMITKVETEKEKYTTISPGYSECSPAGMGTGHLAHMLPAI